MQEFNVSTYIKKGLSGVFLIKLTAHVLAFASSFLLARILGADGYGTFNYVFTLTSVLGVICHLGFSPLLTREVASLNSNKSYALLKGIQLWAFSRSFFISLIPLILGYLIIFAFNIPENTTLKTTLLIGLPIIPFASLSLVRQGALRGFQRVLHSQIPDDIIRPFVLLASVIIIWYLHNSVTPELATATNLVAISISFAVGAYWLVKSNSEQIKQSIPSYQSTYWLKSGLAFVAIALMHTVSTNVDILMLGILRPMDDVGVYSIAIKLSNLVAFPLMVTNIVLAPIFSKYLSENKKEKLQKIVTQISSLAFLTALLIGGGLFIFRSFILKQFGSQFTFGASSLVLLISGQLFSVFAGSVGYLLMMAGKENLVAITIGIGIIINIILNYLLIPIYGMYGAAVATSITIVFFNVFNYYWQRKHVGIKTTILKFI